MKKILITLLFLIGPIAYGQSAFAKAEQLYRADNYEKALVSFTKLYDQDGDNLGVIERLGDIAGHKKDFKTAMKYYQLLVEKKPKDAHYNFKYGGAMGLYAKSSSKLKALGMLDDIKGYLKKAAELDPNHIESRHALSQLYCELPGIVGGSIKQSRFYANELLKISPVDGYLAHGLINEYKEEYEKAVISYTKAIETGGSLLTYRKLATVYENKLKDDKKALQTLKRAQKKHKDIQLTADIAGLEIRVQMNE
jgi:tetratricopeptide (TPR) repeat protein